MNGTNRKNFTLIELLVVIAIIGILAGMLLPALNSAREKARSITCMANIKVFTLAGILYAADNGEYWIPFYQGFKATKGSDSQDYKWYVNFDLPSYTGITPSKDSQTTVYGYTYLKSAHLCPSRAPSAMENGWKNYQNITKHYAQNYLNGSNFPNGDLDTTTYQSKTFYRYNKVRRPSGKLVYTETVRDGVTKDSNPSKYWTRGEIIGKDDYNTWLAYRHNAQKTASTGFFDGHVESASFSLLHTNKASNKIWAPYAD